MISIKPVEKNKEYIVTIESVSSDGNGIAHIEGYAMFIPNSVPGDTLKILAVKTKASYGYGKIIDIITPSPNRIPSVCPVSVQCGGCSFAHMTYETQLELKKAFVNDSIFRIGGFNNFKISEIIGMKNPFRYRNKMIFPFGKDRAGNIQFGFFRERSHDIVPLNDCILGDEINIDILNLIKCYMEKYNIAPYNEETHTGSIRRVFIRKSYHTNELMVVISSNSTSLPNISALITSLTEFNENIVSIILNINTNKNNLVLSDKNVLLYGKPVINDRLCGLEYEISPNSFFQVNPQQTEALYKKAMEYANITGDSTVMDIYCGIGTISLYAAQTAKHVIGIEIVPQAIENARKNAAANDISNVDFYTGDAQIIVPDLIKNGISPEIAILDPPRKGSDINTISAILSVHPDKIIYISCNPSTLARDMKFLAENNYLPKKGAAVDMFPFTTHVECVVLMSRVDK